jgi:hypothetical protein
VGVTPALDAWEALEPADVAEMLEGFDRPWWIAGGWALDLRLGRRLREHADVDVMILRRDQAELFRFLDRWDLCYATAHQTLQPWNGEPLELPIHVVWARRPGSDSWTCEFLLDEADGDTWRYRRNRTVELPLARLGDRVLAPEVVMLYKAKDPGPKEHADFVRVVGALDADARSWLRAALPQGHPWRERL